MSLAAAVALLVAVCVATVTVQYILTQYLLPGSEAQRGWAADNLTPRRHLENLTAWQERVAAHAEAVSVASHAFWDEGKRLGRVERVSHAGLRCSLPAGHPLAIALLRAKYPDGPTELELRTLATLDEVVEAGVDILRAFQ